MSDLVATGVPSRDVGLAWPDLWPLLEPAYAKSSLKLDILSELYARRCVLWAVYAKNKPVAGIVSRLLPREGTSSLNCRLWLVGGHRLSEWAPDFIAKLIPWAKAEGCTVISGSGRKGWTRIVAKFGGVRVADEEGVACWELAL